MTEAKEQQEDHDARVSVAAQHVMLALSGAIGGANACPHHTLQSVMLSIMITMMLGMERRLTPDEFMGIVNAKAALAIKAALAVGDRPMTDPSVSADINRALNSGHH